MPRLADSFHQIDVLSGAIQINPAISFYLVRSRGDLAYSRAVFLFFFALRAHLVDASRQRYMGRSRSRSRSRDRDRGRDRSHSSSSSSSEDSAEREERELKREHLLGAIMNTTLHARSAQYLPVWEFLANQTLGLN